MNTARRSFLKPTAPLAYIQFLLYLSTPTLPFLLARKSTFCEYSLLFKEMPINILFLYNTKINFKIIFVMCQSQWPCDLGHEMSLPTRTMNLNPTQCTDVCLHFFCVCVVLCCNELIPLPRMPTNCM